MSQPGAGGQDPPRNPGPYPSGKAKLKKGDTKKGPTPAANVEEMDSDETVRFRGESPDRIQLGWPLRSGWPNESPRGHGPVIANGALPGHKRSVSDKKSIFVPDAVGLGEKNEDSTTNGQTVSPNDARRHRTPSQRFDISSQNGLTTLAGPNAGLGAKDARRDVSRPTASPASRTGRFAAALQARHGPMRDDGKTSSP